MLADVKYLGRVVKLVCWQGLQWRRAAVAAPTLEAIGFAPAHGNAPAVSAAEWGEVEALQVRASNLSAALDEVAALYQREIAPMERVLRAYRDNPVLARRVAIALLREGRAASVQPHLLLAVLLVENPWVDPGAVSPVGARGLMQVMPLHQGKWRACPLQLDGIDANICYGARIFASYLRQQGGDVERALLRYNGCVNGTNTPDCAQYANHVFARFSRARALATN
jgi:soluble lytic murein transglycosylase-like protein